MSDVIEEVQIETPIFISVVDYFIEDGCNGVTEGRNDVTDGCTTPKPVKFAATAAPPAKAAKSQSGLFARCTRSNSKQRPPKGV